jgi:hypothetical protein
MAALFKQNGEKRDGVRALVMDKLKFLVGTNLLYLEEGEG